MRLFRRRGTRARDARAGDAPWVEKRVEWRAVIAPDIAEGDACGVVAASRERLLCGRRLVTWLDDGAREPGGRARATLSGSVRTFDADEMTNHSDDDAAFSNAFCASSTSWAT